MSQNGSEDAGVNRRKVLKSIGVTAISGTAIGATSVSGTASVAPDSSSLDVDELDGNTREKVVQEAQETATFEKYVDGFEEEAIVKKFSLQQTAKSVFRVQKDDSTNSEYYVVSFPVKIQINEQGISTSTDKESVTADLVITFSATSETGRVVIEKRSNKQVVVQSVNYMRNEGTIEILNQTANVENDNPNIKPTEKLEITNSGVNVTNTGSKTGASSEPDITPTHEDCFCAEVFGAVCNTGCGVSTGVTCAIVTGPSSVFACPVIVGAICAAYTLSDSCPPGDVTKVGACQTMGYC